MSESIHLVGDGEKIQNPSNILCVCCHLIHILVFRIRISRDYLNNITIKHCDKMDLKRRFDVYLTSLSKMKADLGSPCSKSALENSFQF